MQTYIGRDTGDADRFCPKVEGYYSTSTDDNGNRAWRVIYQGLPLCADKATLAECLPVAALFRVAMRPDYWDGDAGGFVPLTNLPGEVYEP